MSDDYKQVLGSAEDAVDMFIPGIKAAIKELEEKHGPLTTDMLRAFAIFQRESGEVADAVLDLTKLATSIQNGFKGIISSDAPYVPAETLVENATQHTGHEIAQCIAVLIYMLINLFGDRVHTEGESIALVPGKDTVN